MTCNFANYLARYGRMWVHLIVPNVTTWKDPDYEMCQFDASGVKEYCIVGNSELCNGFSSCLTDECGCGEGIDVFYCADKSGCLPMKQVSNII